ncbi:MAG: hypothetical protein HQL73_13795 [Magnetococcales bacterium]|nr:hypothetical protein [Magnetococcales bacterium]
MQRSSKMVAARVASVLDPHLFHHWDLKARLGALISLPPLTLPRIGQLGPGWSGFHENAHEELRSLMESITQHLSHANPLSLIDDRSLPHPGDLLRPATQSCRELWYLTLRHAAIFLGAYEQLEIVIKTDNRPKQIIITEKGQRIIIFGNGRPSKHRHTSYVYIADDELFQEHLVLEYSRLHGWQIKKMEGEFGCGFQYAPDSLNDAIPLTETDCAIMRIGHTSLLINSEGKALRSPTTPS